MDIPLVLYRWDKSQSDTEFTISSSRQRNITNNQYLNVSKGEGGQIIGFLEYNKPKEDEENKQGRVIFLNFPTLTRTELAFGTGTHTDLIVIIPKHLHSLVTSGKIVHVDLGNNTEEALQKCINTQAGIIKHAKLGELMGEHANEAEHNFVGDHTFEVRVLKNATKLKYEQVKQFIDTIYNEASKLGNTVNIQKTVQADNVCRETGKRPAPVQAVESDSESHSDTSDMLFLPSKKPTLKGRGRKKTLRRKRHRSLRTRKATRK